MYTHRLSLFAVATTLVLASCSKSPDPLADFEPIATACSAALGTSRQAKVYEGGAPGKWNKIVYGPNKIGYDVRKSDSLVSPYIADIRVAYDDVVLQRETRSDAEAAQVEDGASAVLSGTQSYRFTFAYQDRSWKLQRIDAMNKVTSISDMPESTIEIDIEQLLKEFPEAAACAKARAASQETPSK